jgi:DNA-binding transcriptional regulator YiaG
MAKKSFEDLRRKTFSPERIREQNEWVEQQLLLMDLAEVRKSLGLKQVDIASALEMSQGQVSETERRQDLLVSTVRRYISALGGELMLVAKFPPEKGVGKRKKKRVVILRQSA